MRFVSLGSSVSAVVIIRNMDNLVSSLLMTLLLLFGMGILLVFFIFKQTYTYWDKFNIPVIYPLIPYGSLGKPMTETVSVHFKIASAYRKLKETNQKHGGIYIYLTPYYLPVDHLLIRNILIKDFSYFAEKNMYSNRKKDPLSDNLMTADYQEWRDMRHQLRPIFAKNKLKLMFPLLQVHCDRLVKKIDYYVNRLEPVEIIEVLGCFTTDIMVSCSFGVQCNSLENSNCAFRRVLKQIFYLTPFRLLKADCTRNFPNLARFLGVITFSKKISDFIMKVVSENFDHRIKTSTKCNDLFQSLMEVNEWNETDDSVVKAKIAAQALLFFNAGSQSSSNTIACAVYELGRNTELQDKLRKEVISVLEKHNGTITYEALMEMEYLSKVVDETLRKYPPAATIPRRCVQDYHVEGTDVVLKKGVEVLISVLGIHQDPEYYPDPEVFDPERFNETNKNKRPPCTYLPFLDGPRNCIAKNFGLVQVYLGLVNIIKNFKFSVNSKTGIPVVNARWLINAIIGEMYIDFEQV